MNHATDGLLLAYHDGEVDGPALAELRDHLAVCAQCTQELDTLRQMSGTVHTALAEMDVPAPVPPMRVVVARRSAFGTSGMSGLAKAALLLLALTGVLTAIPGTPLRLALESALARLFEPAPVTDVAPAAAPVPDVRDIRVLPTDGRIRVLVHRPLALDVTVSLTDAEHAVVERSAVGQDVAFRSGPGRIEVSGLQRGSLRILIPRNVTDATVEIDGSVYVYKEDGVLHLSGPAGTAQGEQVSFRFGQ